MSRHVVVNGRELSMNDVGFIDPNSEWSVTVGEDGSVEVNRLDLKEENAKLRELVRDMWEGYNDPRCEECHLKDTPTCADCPICAREALVIDRMRDLGIEVDG